MSFTKCPLYETQCYAIEKCLSLYYYMNNGVVSWGVEVTNPISSDSISIQPKRDRN